MTISLFEQTLNDWGQERVPFLFIVDFEMQKPIAVKLADIDANTILYDINGLNNLPVRHAERTSISVTKKPLSFEAYAGKFQTVYKYLALGDTYLTNLTIKTQIEVNAPLQDIFHAAKAKYKILLKDQFLAFSPEIFVQIRDNAIFSFPMKGTISKSEPDAAEKILNDAKELAEHVTIVDLIRNDLSQVALNVHVSRFRYLEEIKTNQKDLYQVSSEIVGSVDDPFAALGSLLLRLLPAGSVSGAPKPKTLEIIREAEQEPRGYYTGVVGIFDGNMLDSGVIIRYIEQADGKYFYRSGGGITTKSNSESEYKEALDKIYVPVN